LSIPQRWTFILRPKIPCIAAAVCMAGPSWRHAFISSFLSIFDGLSSQGGNFRSIGHFVFSILNNRQRPPYASSFRVRTGWDTAALIDQPGIISFSVIFKRRYPFEKISQLPNKLGERTERFRRGIWLFLGSALSKWIYRPFWHENCLSQEIFKNNA